MESTYLFYDTETTGLNPCFDQIIQFAAIRTDNQFNVLEEYQFFIRLNPDVIPSPQAFLTHGISPSNLRSQPCEYEIIQKIHALFNTPNTLSIGYNNLGFDDEFLRFAFYRNLLPPYTHQWANGCKRLDLYPITLLYYLYQNNALNWPIIDNTPRLKLEHLNACNGWVSGPAHDAMVDVRATLALAKQLKQHKAVWDYALGFFDKGKEITRIHKLPPAFENTPGIYQEALLLHGQLGAKLNYQTPALSLGSHQHYKNQTLWLRLDTDELPHTKSDMIDQTTFVFRKRLAEPPLLLAPLQRFCVRLGKERLEKAHANKAWLKEHPNLLQLISDYYQQYKYPDIPNCDIDADLYQQPFLTHEEQYQCNRFHAAKLTEKPEIVEHMKSERLKKQATRLLARNYANDLPTIDAAEFSNYLSTIYSKTPKELPTDYKGEPHISASKTMATIQEMISAQMLNEKQTQLLNELLQYLDEFDSC